MTTEQRASRTARDEGAFGLAVCLAALAVVAFLPLRQGSTFGHASSLVGGAAVLASVLTLGWTLSSLAGRGISVRAVWCAVGTGVLNLFAIYTLVSRLMAF